MIRWYELCLSQVLFSPYIPIHLHHWCFPIIKEMHKFIITQLLLITLIFCHWWFMVCLPLWLFCTGIPWWDNHLNIIQFLGWLLK
jgi:hypothetical protein